ncbi:UNVERIFIED_ORG: hypothetical protein M2442_001709 [Methylorubrum zatmanii]|nr:hypothetical protein [Methylorubrum zatmanii]
MVRLGSSMRAMQGVDQLAEIVRRNVGGHAHRDAARAVDQQVREAGRQDGRLLVLPVVVRLEIDGVLVDVREERAGGLSQARFGVAHGRGRIAVDRAEIALPVDEHQAHREVLGHADQGVVDRLVAVRMVLTDHVADDAGRFDVAALGQVPALMRREQDAPVHRLEAVARIGQRAAHDHAHGVIEVGPAHLVGDGDGLDVGRGRGRAGAGLVVVVCQRRSLGFSFGRPWRNANGRRLARTSQRAANPDRSPHPEVPRSGLEGSSRSRASSGGSFEASASLQHLRMRGEK